MKWFLALPKLLLRGTRRGGQNGRGSKDFAVRFEAVRENRWGFLLTHFTNDEDYERRRRLRRQGQNRKSEDPSISKARLRKTVLGLASRGHTGRA